MYIDVWGQTDPGKVRTDNQDALFFAHRQNTDIALRQLQQNGVLMVVVDGFGQGTLGQEASHFLLHDAVQGYYHSDGQNPPENLRAAIQTANENAAARFPQQNAAATLTAAVILQNQLYLAHIGESRAYLLRNGSMRQLTTDHVQGGQVTRYLIADPKAQPDVLLPIELRAGDRLLLCSDGLYDPFEDAAAIQQIAGSSSPQRTVRRLITQANQRGGPDNITVIIADVQTTATLPGWQKIILWSVIVAALLSCLGFMAEVIRVLPQINQSRTTPDTPITPVPTVVAPPETSYFCPPACTPLSLMEQTRPRTSLAAPQHGYLSLSFGWSSHPCSCLLLTGEKQDTFGL